MTQKLLQINFKFTSSAAEYGELVAPFADPIGAVPGLDWKVWIVNEKDNEAGGIYLFKDQSSADAYLSGEIVKGLGKQPTIKDISAKLFDVDESLTQKTRGPIKAAVTA